MAITFTTPLREDILLDSHSNNVVEFYSTLVTSTPFKCIIDVQGESYEITPGADGGFYFNFKVIFKKLVLDYFEDSPVVELNAEDLTSFVVPMNSVYLQTSIVFRIYFTGGQSETASKTVNLLQSAGNFQDFKTYEIQATDSFALLAQPEPLGNRIFRMTYFRGFPFDVQAYKKTSGNVVITNRTNLTQVTLSLPNKINRIFFSDTKTDSTIEDVLPMGDGQNVLEFNTGALTTIYLDVKDIQCGKYIKWKKQKGGWGYWLFDRKYATERDIDDLGYISNDYANLDNNNFIKNIGKRGQDRINIGAINIPHDSRTYLEDLFDSPKVYLFTGERYSKNNVFDWLAVRLVTDSFIVEDYTNRPFDLDLTIELPVRNSLKL